MQRIGSEETIPSTPQSPKKVTLAPLPGVGSPAGSSSPTTSFKEAVTPSLDILKVPDGLDVNGSLMYVWNLDNWSEIKKSEKFKSEPFKVNPDDDHEWRLLIFPNGNRNNETVSAFLECCPTNPQVGGDTDEAMTVDEGDAQDQPPSDKVVIPETKKWHVCAYFSIFATHADAKDVFSPPNSAHHRFSKREVDWGFSNLVSHATLAKPHDTYKIPILDNNKLKIVVFIKQVVDSTGVLWHNFLDWDSKLETGFVGIKNQGATCYLNSLIQSLYYTNYFRKATYEIPTQNDEPTKSVAYALQRLFYHMQFSDQAVGTNELTKSFGWDTMDAFHQHDIQELNRVLQDNLENTMKGTPAEGAIRKLFTGKMKSFIKCVNVDFESSRMEEFYDIQLNVKGLKNLYESFVEYCKVEMLDGENKYDAEGHGLQDAKKGVIFDSFPPVLHLQLKRFDYDMERDQFVKINDRHEFPLEINLDEFLHAGADKSVAQNYRLQGVLVHSGDLNAGHYFALIRPKKNGAWFKYDDDKVVPASKRDVLDANFGGEPTITTAKGGFKNRFYTNAYMLVYIRDTDEDEILADVTEDQIPIHLRERVKKDIEEAKARLLEEQERHLYMKIQVVNDHDLQYHSGFDIGFPLDKNATATNSPVRVFKMRRDMSLEAFKEYYANEINVKDSQVRLWNIVTRQNKTCRIEAPYPTEKLSHTLHDIFVQVKNTSDEMRVYAQLSTTPIAPNSNVFFKPRLQANTPSTPLSPKGPVEIILFLKQYDPYTQTLRVFQTVSVGLDDQVESIISLIKKNAGYQDGQELILFEEVKPGMIEPIASEATFAVAELLDGDIICFQPKLTDQEIMNLPDPQMAYAPAYYEKFMNRIEVSFKHRSAQGADVQELRLVLNKKMTYEEVVSELGHHIQHDSTKIKLYSAKGNGNVGVSISQRSNLQEMLAANQYATYYHINLMYYELLDISLEELDRKRYVKVSYLEEGIKETGPLTLLIEKTANLGDLMKLLISKLSADFKITVPQNVRFFEAVNSRRIKTFAMTDTISQLNEYGSLFLESLYEEEASFVAGSSDGAILEAFHFHRDVYRAHSIPCTFLLVAGEVFSATKDRLAARLGLSRKEFDRIKVALVPKTGKPVYPDDDDTIPTISDLAVGLDHVDKGRKSGGGGGVKIN